jgi:tRNA G46 methylase TrmB
LDFQVEGFALLLWQLTQSAAVLQQPLHVVEFGCGSGNLVLPLACLFPSFTFTALDMKPSAVGLLQQRVQQAKLKNVVAIQQRIEQYDGE